MSTPAAAVLRGTLALFLLLASAVVSLAEEEILFFRSDVEVQTNGDFIVAETIRVHTEAREIRRGIYRDFPIKFEDADGHVGRNGFELISATRDGRPENTNVVEGPNFVRVYLGREDVFLPPGVYTYVLTYRTTRQIRYFDDHDEVYWNATGTEWSFPILQAVAEIDLPDGGVARDTIAFTGAYGSTAQNATSSVSRNGNVATFQTTQPLGPRQGLTVAVKFDKGVVAEPSEQQKAVWYLLDNLGTAIAVFGLVVVALYYLRAWLRVGRDPPRGVVVPRWDLPEGVSPALTHYIWNKGLKNGGFPAISAAAINLAVNGYLELDDFGDTITLKRTDKPIAGVKFPVGEAAILGKIEGYDGSLTVSKSNGSKVQSLASKFSSAMAREHGAQFYHANTGSIVLGVILSVAAIVATFVFGRLSENTVGVTVMTGFLGVFVTAFLIVGAQFLGRSMAGKVRLSVFFLAAGVALLNSGLMTAARHIDWIDQPFVTGALAAIVMINVLSFFLMGAPTPLGQQRTDEIEGLKRYLTVAEKDRMNMAGAPTMSPQHFETLLPYAVALGVEKQWSKAFQAWLAAAVAAGVAAATTYHGPGWYRGESSFDTGRIGNTMGDLASSMANSFTASLPTPKSSSSGFSGGGGSSGGGGGGGGGGGW